MDNQKTINALLGETLSDSSSLTVGSCKLLFALLLDRLDELDRRTSPDENCWETIPSIKKRFHLSYERAKALCLSPGVRCSKGKSGWPRYNVADCSRIFAGEALTSGSSLTRLPSAKRVMLSNVVSVG